MSTKKQKGKWEEAMVTWNGFACCSHITKWKGINKSVSQKNIIECIGSGELDSSGYGFNAYEHFSRTATIHEYCVVNHRYYRWGQA